VAALLNFAFAVRTTKAIPRQGNAEADKLVNEALDRKELSYKGE